MGSCYSVSERRSSNTKKVIIAPPTIENTDTRCGGLSSFSLSFQEKDETRWKQFVNTKSARNMFIDDKSMPQDASDSMFELRLFLNEIDLLKPLLVFANQFPEWVRMVECWTDISYFKCMDQAGDQQWYAAMHICDKYLNSELESPIKGILDLKCTDRICSTVRKESEDGVGLAVDLFAEIRMFLLSSLHDRVWVKFRCDKLYKEAVDSLKKSITVGHHDFLFMEKLGEGGCGFVVHAMKYSTGQHYAVKVQNKTDMLCDYRDCPHRVTFERQAMSKCNHHFIMGLDYAFQTPDYVMMAMELGRCGTLYDAIRTLERQRMPEEMVQFYAAEMVLALSHLHKMGFMYRDLKPGNVIIMPDGHLKLSDLGGIVDPMERVLKPANMLEKALNFLSEYAGDDYHQHSSSNHQTSSFESGGESAGDSTSRSSRLLRTYSIVGTRGYMAPEMLRMDDEQFEYYDEGYSEVVDWWSLGAVCTELLLGYNPLKSIDVKSFAAYDSPADRAPAEYVEVLKLLNNVASDEAILFIRHLLVIDGKKRLGAGRHGLQQIKRHAFFKGIHWQNLGRKLVKPPYLPPIKPVKKVEYDSFNSMVQNVSKRKHMKPIFEDGNTYFESWDYASPQAVKLEIFSSGVQGNSCSGNFD